MKWTWVLVGISGFHVTLTLHAIGQPGVQNFSLPLLSGLVSTVVFLWSWVQYQPRSVSRPMFQGPKLRPKRNRLAQEIRETRESMRHQAITDGQAPTEMAHRLDSSAVSLRTPLPPDLTDDEDRASALSSVSDLDLGDRSFDLRECVASVLRWMEPKARQRNVELKFRLGRGVPLHLVGRPDDLQQVLMSLVHNAVRFTEFGEVEVHVDVDWLTEDRVMLDYAVTDNGDGITPREQGRIMGLIARASLPPDDRPLGSLGECARIVRTMGGYLEVDSDLGEGTTARFTMCAGLEIEAEAMPLSEIAEVPELDGQVVLVVDNDCEMRTEVQELLSTWGLRPTGTHDSMQADLLMEAAKNLDQPFDIILMNDWEAQVSGAMIDEAVAMRERLGSGAPAVVVVVEGDDVPKTGDPAVIAIGAGYDAATLHRAMARALAGIDQGGMDRPVDRVPPQAA